MTDTDSYESSILESIREGTRIETIIQETKTTDNEAAVLITEHGEGTLLSDSLTVIPIFSQIPRQMTGAYKEFQSISQNCLKGCKW
jgi:hypothetical protein